MFSIFAMRAVSCGENATPENGVSNIQMPISTRAATVANHSYSVSSLAHWIVGINDNREIGADILRMAGQVGGLVRRMMAGMGNDLALAVRFLNDDFDGAFALFLGQRPELAHGAGAENAVDTQCIGVMAHIAPEPCFVQPDHPA